MRPILSSVLAALAGALLASACYAERQPPPAFRYACDADGDCLDGQSCIDGLCETPCTTETFADVCVNGELVCLNGVCSSGCEVGKQHCHARQECVDLGLDVGGGGGFLGGGNTDATVGVCMRPCTADSCADAEVCLEGFCVPTCDGTTPCPAGLACLGGLCLPDAGTEGTSGTDSATVTASSATASDATASDATTSDATTSDTSGNPGSTGGGT